MTSEYTSSVLVVSATDKAYEFVKSILPREQFAPIVCAHGAGEVERILLQQEHDIVIINTPLQDEFGTELALNIADQTNSGVLILVKQDHYEQVSYKAEEYGILTLSRPCTNNDILQALKLLVATQLRLKAMQRKAQSLEEKMQEIRIVNRAKGLLMDKMKFSENEAHKYIERNAMDRCVKRTVIANEIIDRFAG